MRRAAISLPFDNLRSDEDAIHQNQQLAGQWLGSRSRDGEGMREQSSNPGTAVPTNGCSIAISRLRGRCKCRDSRVANVHLPMRSDEGRCLRAVSRALTHDDPHPARCLFHKEPSRALVETEIGRGSDGVCALRRRLIPTARIGWQNSSAAVRIVRSWGPAAGLTVVAMQPG